MSKTLRFQIVTGINSGYYHKNEQNNYLQYVGKLWQKLAKEEYKISNIYVSAIIQNSKVIYSEDWGCPEGGEDAVIITGVANHDFVNDIELWKNSVINIVRKLKKELNQDTITCKFMESDLYYFK